MKIIKMILKNTSKLKIEENSKETLGRIKLEQNAKKHNIIKAALNFLRSIRYIILLSQEKLCS